MKIKRSIYYAIDDHPIYKKFLLLSIESLRYFAPKENVIVVFYGKLDKSFHEKLCKFNIRVIHITAKPQLPSTFLKWISLQYLPATEQLLFLDADTIVLDSFSNLFRDKSDLLAFKEKSIFTEHRRGDLIIQRQVNRQKFLKKQKALKAKKFPVINSSVVLMSNKFRKQLIEKLSIMEDLVWSFVIDENSYPTKNWWILEEITISLIIGTLKNISYASWKTNQVVHFNDFYANPKYGMGSLMHIGHGHMVQFFSYIQSFDIEKKLKKAVRIRKKRYQSFRQRLY